MNELARRRSFAREKAFASSAIITIGAIFAIAPSLTGCSTNQQADPRTLTALVSVEGSDTMNKIINSWAKSFMKQNPDVPISMTSGDSGGGIAALINRTTDVAAASRDMTKEEDQLATAKGLKLKKVTVARDCIAIIENETMEVPNLNMLQLQKVFVGEIGNWRDVGGPDHPIRVFRREPSSGTSKYMQEHVLGGKPYVQAAVVADSNESMSKEISADRHAIGYVGMGFVHPPEAKVKVVPLKLSKDSPTSVSPTQISTTADYPISRPLFFFHDERPKESVQKFVDFCLSSDGQKIVQEEGFARAN